MNAATRAEPDISPHRTIDFDADCTLELQLQDERALNRMSGKSRPLSHAYREFAELARKDRALLRQRDKGRRDRDEGSSASRTVMDGCWGSQRDCKSSYGANRQTSRGKI